MIASRDGIFKHPNKLVKLANRIDYSNVGYVRGVRSKPVHEIDKELFESVNTKILSCFYPDTKIEFFARTYFQKNEYDINDGWVHQDNCMITGIVYLNPDNTSGTSLYNIKDNCSLDVLDQNRKQDYFKNYNKYSEEQKKEIQQLKIKNNSMFYKTVSFSGEYNRLVAFDGKMFHSSEIQEKNKERLILISFIEQIKVVND
tara:strand:- start:3469 stop:4071 length:603 start_codon:yes stop_codon:yes gene_type:complete